MARGFKRLEDHGLVGSLETCALIGSDGSIDWCCLPHLESSSLLAAILDVDKGGHFHLKPRGQAGAKQTYIGNTNVLQTMFETPSGVVTLTDFMPVKGEGDSLHRAILRQVACRQGRVGLEIELKPRFDYARAVPTVEPAEDGIVARWHDQSLFLQFPFPLQLGEREARGTFPSVRATGHGLSSDLRIGCLWPLRSAKASWVGESGTGQTGRMIASQTAVSSAAHGTIMLSTRDWS